jgi:hypothetical protein
MSLVGRLAWLLAPYLATDIKNLGFAAFMEKMGQFNREKTPERVVHARGMVAKGYFEVRYILCRLRSQPVHGAARLPGRPCTALVSAHVEPVERQICCTMSWR